MYSSLHAKMKPAISLYSSAVFVLQMLHNFQVLISFSLFLSVMQSITRRLFGFHHKSFTWLSSNFYLRFYFTLWLNRATIFLKCMCMFVFARLGSGVPSIAMTFNSKSNSFRLDIQGICLNWRMQFEKVVHTVNIPCDITLIKILWQPWKHFDKQGNYLK